MTPRSERILMTADPTEGVWTYALELSRALQPHGVTVTLATMGTRLTPRQRSAALALENVLLHESTYRLEWMKDPWEDVAAAGEWLLALEAEHTPDLVHLNGYAHASLGWHAPVLVAAHSCVYSRYRWVHGSLPPPRWERYRRRVAQGLEQADVVAAPTEFMLAALRKHYGFAGTGHVVYHGLRPDGIAVEEKEPIILSEGRPGDEAVNVAALDAAAPHLSWPIYLGEPVSGSTTTRAALSHVSTLGSLTPEEWAIWRARAGIFALPARYEPFGFAPLRAALSGCALVLGDIPSLREVWGHCALFVPPDEPQLLTRALTMLSEDPALRERLARRAYRRALRYLPPRMAHGYMALYASAVGRYNVETAM